MPLVDTENVLHFWRLFYWLVRKPVRKMCAFWAHFDDKTGRRRALDTMPLVGSENFLHFWRSFSWLVRKTARKRCDF
jgi:hypothetical protein